MVWRLTAEGAQRQRVCQSCARLAPRVLAADAHTMCAQTARAVLRGVRRHREPASTATAGHAMTRHKIGHASGTSRGVCSVCNAPDSLLQAEGVCVWCVKDRDDRAPDLGLQEIFATLTPAEKEVLQDRFGVRDPLIVALERAAKRRNTTARLHGLALDLAREAHDLSRFQVLDAKDIETLKAIAHAIADTADELDATPDEVSRRWPPGDPW